MVNLYLMTLCDGFWQGEGIERLQKQDGCMVFTWYCLAWIQNMHPVRMSWKP